MFVELYVLFELYNDSDTVLSYCYMELLYLQ